MSTQTAAAASSSSDGVEDGGVITTKPAVSEAKLSLVDSIVEMFRAPCYDPRLVSVSSSVDVLPPDASTVVSTATIKVPLTLKLNSDAISTLVKVDDKVFERSRAMMELLREISGAHPSQKEALKTYVEQSLESVYTFLVHANTVAVVMPTPPLYMYLSHKITGKCSEYPATLTNYDIWSAYIKTFLDLSVSRSVDIGYPLLEKSDSDDKKKSKVPRGNLIHSISAIRTMQDVFGKGHTQLVSVLMRECLHDTTLCGGLLEKIHTFDHGSDAEKLFKEFVTEEKMKKYIVAELPRAALYILKHCIDVTNFIEDCIMNELGIYDNETRSLLRCPRSLFSSGFLSMPGVNYIGERFFLSDTQYMRARWEILGRRMKLKKMDVDERFCDSVDDMHNLGGTTTVVRNSSANSSSSSQIATSMPSATTVTSSSEVTTTVPQSKILSSPSPTTKPTVSGSNTSTTTTTTTTATNLQASENPAPFIQDYEPHMSVTMTFGINAASVLKQLLCMFTHI